MPRLSTDDKIKQLGFGFFDYFDPIPADAGVNQLFNGLAFGC